MDQNVMDKMKMISETICSTNSEPVFIMVFKGNATFTKLMILL
jgi:hypothetical protein